MPEAQPGRISTCTRGTTAIAPASPPAAKRRGCARRFRLLQKALSPTLIPFLVIHECFPPICSRNCKSIAVPASLKKKRRWPLFLGLAVVAVGVLWWLSGGRPVEVETAKAALRRRRRPGLGARRLRLRRRRDASPRSRPRSPARCSEVLIEEGQRVDGRRSAGALDPADADAQRDLAQSQLASAQSQLAEAQRAVEAGREQRSRPEPRTGRQDSWLPGRRWTAPSPSAIRAPRAWSACSAVVQRVAGPADDRRARRRQHHHPRAVRRRDHRQGRAAGRNDFADLRPAAASSAPASAPSSTWIRWKSRSTSTRPTSAACSRRCRSRRCSTPIPDWKIPGEVIAIIPTADRSKATVKVRIALKTQGRAHRAGHGRARELPGEAAKPGARQADRRAGCPTRAVVRPAMARACVFVVRGRQGRSASPSPPARSATSTS